MLNKMRNVSLVTSSVMSIYLKQQKIYMEYIYKYIWNVHLNQNQHKTAILGTSMNMDCTRV